MRFRERINKKCAKCKTVKTMNHFNRDERRRTPDGWRPNCKECQVLIDAKAEARRAAEPPKPPKPVATKLCPHCKTEKPRADFPNPYDKGTTKRAFCRDCYTLALMFPQPKPHDPSKPIPKHLRCTPASIARALGKPVATPPIGPRRAPLTPEQMAWREDIRRKLKAMLTPRA